MISIFINQVILSLFVLKWFCQKGLIFILVLFTYIHLRIYAPSMIITLGNFNIDLIKFDSFKHKFINDLFSDCLQPHIYQPQLGNCGKNKTIIIICFPILLSHLSKMLPQVILYYIWSLSTDGFSFGLISFLIIIATKKKNNK